MVDKSLPVTLSTFVAKLAATSAAFAFNANAICVAVLIGLSRSAVLFTLSIDKAVFIADILVTPVPPAATGKTPITFSAATLLANCA